MAEYVNPVPIPRLPSVGNLNRLAPAPNIDIGNIINTVGRAGLGLATGGVSEIVAQVLNIVPSIFQGIIGGRQLKQAGELEKQYPMPVAEVAPSIDRLTGYTYGRTLRQDIPGGDIYRNQIRGATAAGLRAASELGSGAEAYGALGELVGREQEQMANLAATTAQQVAGYESDYMRALEQRAGEENRVWEWNKAQPYLQAAAIAQQLRESGWKNLYSGGANVFGSTAEAVPDISSSLLYGRNTPKTTGSMDTSEFTEIIRNLIENR